MCEALGADPVDLSALASALRYIGIGLTKEVENIRQEACHSLPIAMKAAAFKPFYDSSLQCLSDLSAAVDHRGPPRLTTYDRDQPQVWLQDQFKTSAKTVFDVVSFGFWFLVYLFRCIDL